NVFGCDECAAPLHLAEQSFIDQGAERPTDGAATDRYCGCQVIFGPELVVLGPVTAADTSSDVLADLVVQRYRGVARKRTNRGVLRLLGPHVRCRSPQDVPRAVGTTFSARPRGAPEPSTQGPHAARPTGRRRRPRSRPRGSAPGVV